MSNPPHIQALLEDADWQDLRKRGFYFACKLRSQSPQGLQRPEPDDVVNMAVAKIWSGDRKWNPEKVPLLIMLFGTVRGVYHNELKKIRQNLLQLNEEAHQIIYLESYAFSYEDINFIRKAFQYLKSHNPSLAEFYARANKLLAKDCATDAEVADRMGMSRPAFFKQKEKIRKLIEEWRNDDADKKVTYPGESR